MSKIGLFDLCICRFCYVFVNNEDRNKHLTYHQVKYIDKDFNQMFSYHPSARNWRPECHDGLVWDPKGYDEISLGKVEFNTKYHKELDKRFD